MDVDVVPSGVKARDLPPKGLVEDSKFHGRRNLAIEPNFGLLRAASRQHCPDYVIGVTSLDFSSKVMAVER